MSDTRYVQCEECQTINRLDECYEADDVFCGECEAPLNADAWGADDVTIEDAVTAEEIVGRVERRREYEAADVVRRTTRYAPGRCYACPPEIGALPEGTVPGAFLKDTLCEECKAVDKAKRVKNHGKMLTTGDPVADDFADVVAFGEGLRAAWGIES